MDSFDEMKKRMVIQKELLKHGLAKTSDEALNKADDVMQGKILSDKDIAISNRPIVGNMELDELRVENRKIANQINQMTRDYAKLFEIMKDKLNSLESEIKYLKNESIKINREIRPDNSAFENKEQNYEQRSADRRIETPKYAEPKSEFEKNQRVGGYKSDDVDINKMFYFGNK